MTPAGRTPLIALYGSLRRGEPAYGDLDLDRHLRFVSPCRIAGRIYDLGDYPGLLLETGEVAGELFEMISSEAIDVLDRFECFDASREADSLFIRVPVVLIEPNAEAWVSVYNLKRDANRLDRSRIIATGDWKVRS